MKFKNFLALSLVVLLGACGGSNEPATVTVLGRALLASPVVGATLEVRDAQGQSLKVVSQATDDAGIIHLALPVANLSRFRVIVTGGTYEGKAFEDTLMLDVDGFNPAVDQLYLNAVTTMISRYRDVSPRTSVATASAKVKTFLKIPQSSQAGFDVSNPLQDYFRHDQLLSAARASGSGRLDDYLANLVSEVNTGVAPRSFARTQLLGGGVDSIIEALMKFLGKELAGEGSGLVFEQISTALGLDGTAEILRELHEINHKLDKLTALTEEVLTAVDESLLQALTVKLSGDLTAIKGLYGQLTTLAQAPARVCATAEGGAPLDPACEELRQSEMKLRQETVARLRDQILNGTNGSTAIEFKLAQIASTLVSSPVEPGLLARASEFFKKTRQFDAPIDDPRLVIVNEYYKTLQAMGIHLLVESKMAQQAPAGSSQTDKVVFKANATREANAALNLFDKTNAQAQTDQMVDLRYKNELAVEQLRANLIWLRAPFSNLKTPVLKNGSWDSDWPSEASKICRQLAVDDYAGHRGWRLPSEKELHAFVKGSPNDSGNADGGTGIFEWLVKQGFQSGPGDGQLNQRGIVVDSTMKTAYFSSTGVAGGYTEALWDYGVDSAADIPMFRSGAYIPSIAGAWCVTSKGGAE